MRELMLSRKMLAHLDAASPGIWREEDRIGALCGSVISSCDSSVFLPLRYWRQAFSDFGAQHHFSDKADNSTQTCAFLGAWRHGDDVARFDPDLYAGLMETPAASDLPSEILWRLPASNVETPGLEAYDVNDDRFLAMSSENAENADQELCQIFLNGETEGLAGIISRKEWSQKQPSHLVQPGMIAKSPANKPLPSADEPRNAYPAFKTVISLLHNIGACALLNGKSNAFAKTSYMEARSTKNDWRIFPHEQAKLHTLARKIGRILKRLLHGKQTERVRRKSPGPHLQRVHRHGFLSGTKKEQKKRIYDLTWIPQTPILMEEDALPN